MRKILLFAFMQLCCCGLFAQTTVETALELQIGDNSCDVTGTGYVSAYFKYTVPAESSQLVTVSAASSSLSFTMSEDGTYNTQIVGISSYTSTSVEMVFPVEAGQTVYLAVAGYNVTHFEFTMSAENAEIDGGATCDAPIAIVNEARTFIPSHYDNSTYSSTTYLSYACPEDGVLEMLFSSYVQSVSVSEGCDGVATTVSISYGSGGSYTGKVQVEGGKNYILAIKTTSSSPMFATFTLTHPTVGASCDMPFGGVDEGNMLPAAAGTYWYSYTATQTGYVQLSSTSSLPGGSVSVYSSCGGYSTASVDGCFLLRFSVYSGTTYLICIEKTEATASDETFDITCNAESAGDSFNNPIEIEIGTTTVPEYNGNYYYQVTVPGEGSKFLKVTTDVEFYSPTTQVAIMPAANQYSRLAVGTNDVKAEVTAGESYIICWTLDEDINGFGFTVSIEDIAQGEVASNPIQAVLGNNTLTAGNDKYYTYTATKNGWLKITPDENIITTAISFPIVSGSYVSYRTAVKDGFATKTEIKEGESYLIQFSGMSMDGTFTLEETDYAAGESKETAIVVEGNTAAIPEKAQTFWYRYTAPQEGMLTISANIDYVMTSSYRYPSVGVYRENDNYPTMIMQSSSEGTVYSGSFVAAENELFYVEVTMVTAQSDKSLTFEIRDFEPGETSAYPIELTEGDNELIAASRLNPVWYGAYFNEGEVTISSTDYFTMTLYKADDLNTSLAIANYVYGEAPDYIGSYELNYTVIEAGSYLMKVEQAYAGDTIHVSAAIETGIDDIEAASGSVIPGARMVIVTPDTPDAFVAVYNMSGQLIKAATISECTEIPLEKGLYIVTVNGHAVKVVVHE